ncbi:hypothetical protein U1Q18_048415 [Sarracenia purpurea var. burkii]
MIGGECPTSFNGAAQQSAWRRLLGKTTRCIDGAMRSSMTRYNPRSVYVGRTKAVPYDLSMEASTYLDKGTEGTKREKGEELSGFDFLVDTVGVVPRSVKSPWRPAESDLAFRPGTKSGARSRVT